MPRYAVASLAIVMSLAFGSLARGQATVQVLDAFKAPGRIILEGNRDGADAGLVLTREAGVVPGFKLSHKGDSPVRVKEVVALSIVHNLPPETVFYGEGFQMLSQTGGTLGSPINLGHYTDASHYKMPQAKDAIVAYGAVTLSPPAGDRVLLGFGSCRRFVGRFEVRAKSIDVVIDTEGLELKPGESWDLEEFVYGFGKDREDLLDQLATRLSANHPPRIRPASAPPAGWCSWYCFGPGVTAKQVISNLDVIASKSPQLRYVQLDDGYQAAMGDWLDVGKAFGGGVREVLATIRQRGFEPAIWVAPFIAERDSNLFREHPDWFMKGDDGQPLASNKVTFGGWRRGPWYALDGTHPDAQKHLESVFRTMRNGWGCTYFKLDANFWGTMHGGKLHDPKATRVEAYRRGMQAVLRGAGDSFILGCNHPLWPSLGLIDGSRSSGDIHRSWGSFAETARENLSRNWQNGRLWWNDPDCAVFTGKLSEDEFQFHATALRATGGLVLSGDDLTKLDPAGFAMLRKLLPPSGIAARFDDESFDIGRAKFSNHEEVYVFNRTAAPRDITIPLNRRSKVVDFWSGADLGTHAGQFKIGSMPPHSARLFRLTAEITQ